MDTFDGMPQVDGVTHHTAVVDGLRLHYAEAGEGSPVVLLHGWPQHWWSWRRLIPALAERHRVICPDLRGLGWSEGPGSASRTRDMALGRLGRDVIGLLDAIGVDRFRVAGHDWGGLTTYRLAIDHPHRVVRAVALAAAHPWAVPSRPRVYFRPWHIWTYASLGRAGHALGLPRYALRSWRRVGRFTPDEESVYLDRMDRPGVAVTTRSFDRNVLTREIPHFVRCYRSVRIRVPVLHLEGAEDPLTIGTARNHHRYADDMRSELVPGCGHFLAEERPDEVLDRMTGFLAA